MFDLIISEWKKNNIGKYIRNAAIMTGVLLILMVSTAGEMNAQDSAELYNKSMVSVSIELFMHMGYIVFTSIMLATFVVSGYKNKTMNLMFTYPIKRQKILAAQILSVWIFNVTALILSKFLAYAMFALASRFIQIDMSGIFYDSISFYLDIIISSIMMVSICFIALLIGMLMKSTKATIVASIILVCLTQGNIGALTLVDNLPFYLVLFILSLVSIFLSVYRIEKKDI